MKKISKLLIFFLAIFTVSCTGKYEAPKSNTVAMSGKWWYELIYDDNQDGVFNEDDGDEILVSYEDYGGPDLLTSNTNANDVDSVFISDKLAPGFGRWPFTIHAPVDVATLTFKPTTGLKNRNVSGETVSVIEGKILKGAARTKSGGVADSIFIEFEFSDDPGTYYIFSGHRDSGQTEDQY